MDAVPTGTGTLLADDPSSPLAPGLVGARGSAPAGGHGIDPDPAECGHFGEPDGARGCWLPGILTGSHRWGLRVCVTSSSNADRGWRPRSCAPTWSTAWWTSRRCSLGGSGPRWWTIGVATLADARRWAVGVGGAGRRRYPNRTSPGTGIQPIRDARGRRPRCSPASSRNVGTVTGGHRIEDSRRLTFAATVVTPTSRRGFHRGQRGVASPRSNLLAEGSRRCHAEILNRSSLGDDDRRPVNPERPSGCRTGWVDTVSGTPMVWRGSPVLTTDHWRVMRLTVPADLVALRRGRRGPSAWMGYSHRFRHRR